MQDLFKFKQEVKEEIEKRTGVEIELDVMPYLMCDVRVALPTKDAPIGTKPDILVYSAVRMYPNRVIALEEYVIACIKKGEIITQEEALAIYNKFNADVE